MESDDKRRYRRLTFRVSNAEHRALRASACRAGLEFSAYARSLLLNAKPPRRARKPAVEAALLTEALARLGTTATALRRLEGFARSMPTLVGQRELLRTLSEIGACRLRLLQALRRKPGPA